MWVNQEWYVYFMSYVVSQSITWLAYFQHPPFLYGHHFCACGWHECEWHAASQARHVSAVWQNYPGGTLYAEEIATSAEVVLWSNWCRVRHGLLPISKLWQLEHEFSLQYDCHMSHWHTSTVTQCLCTTLKLKLILNTSFHTTHVVFANPWCQQT